MPRKTAVPKPASKRGGFHSPTQVELSELPAAISWDGVGRKSIYDQALNQLLDAPATHGLRFATCRCRATVMARAKKLGMKIALAVTADGALWVKLLRLDAGKLRTSANGEESPRDAVRRLVREAARTTAEIHDYLQQQFPGTMMPATAGLLESLRVVGQIAKKDDLKWYLVKK